MERHERWVITSRTYMRSDGTSRTVSYNFTASDRTLEGVMGEWQLHCKWQNFTVIDGVYEEWVTISSERWNFTRSKLELYEEWVRTSRRVMYFTMGELQLHGEWKNFTRKDRTSRREGKDLSRTEFVLHECELSLTRDELPLNGRALVLSEHY